MERDEFHDYSFMRNSFAALHEMKYKGEFCDMTIKFGSHAISAHRNVIVAGIPYFRGKLTYLNSETDLNDGVTEFNLNVDALESLIEFCYTSKIYLTTENVRALLRAATFLGINSAIDACCKFIVEKLTADKVLSVREYAESVNSSELLESIDSYVCEHFDQVSASKIFLDAPFSYVKELIGRENLKPSEEEKVLDFVLKWVKKSPDERAVNLEELLRKVRMSLVQPDFLTDCLKEDVIARSIPCRNILKDARTFHFLPHRRAMISSFETSVRGNLKKRTRGSEGWAPGIYAICSLPEKLFHSGAPYLPPQSLLYFDPVNKEWSIVDALSFTLHSVSCSLIQWNGKLYFYDADYIRTYDTPTGGWSSSSVYIGQRFNAGVTLLQNKLYVCGGTAAVELFPLDTIICFDFVNTSTTVEICLPFRGTHLGAVSLNGSLYILGGKDNIDQYLRSVWNFDIWNRQWTERTSMQYSRCSMGCAVLDGKIYVCGGMSTGGVTRTAEVFDPLLNKWTLLPQMPCSVLDISLIPYDGKLYALGGRRRRLDRCMSTVYMYDPKTAKWDCCKGLPTTFEFLKAASIEQTPT